MSELEVDVHPTAWEATVHAVVPQGRSAASIKTVASQRLRRSLDRRHMRMLQRVSWALSPEGDLVVGRVPVVPAGGDR